MRPILPSALLALTLAGPALADQVGVGEQLLLAPPDGWRPVHLQRSEKMVVTRLYPPGQDENSWTEIMTVQMYPNSTQSARQFADSIVRYTQESCEAAGPGPVTERAVNGYPVATVSVACTRGRTSGMGGFVLSVAIKGKEGLYAVQRQWRGPAFARDQNPALPPDLLRQWSAFAQTVSLCDTRDSRHPCPP